MQSLDWRQALKVFEQIRALVPEDGLTRNKIVDLNLRLNQDTQAISEMDNYLTSLIKNGQNDHALAWLEELVEEYPDHQKMRHRLAELYRKLERTEDAVRHLDHLGEQLIEAGDQEGAIKTIQAIIAINPPNVSDYQRLLNELQKS